MREAGEMVEGKRPAAFFDVDRTLVGPPSMEKIFVGYLIRKGYLNPADMFRYLGFLARNLGELNRDLVHGNKYHLRHKQSRQLRFMAARCFRNEIAPRISPAGRQAVAEHQAQGHMVILLTGSLEPLAELLRRELGADLALAAPLAESAGWLEGTLSAPRPYGLEKARLVRDLAQRLPIDLARSYAYGDHHSDRHVLAEVGNPVAVNPNPGLRREANDHGWPIRHF